MLVKNYYVYVFLNTLKPGIYKYDDYIFEYEPFYIGKGINDRMCRSLKDNYRNNKIKAGLIDKIHKNNMSILSRKIKENISEEEALSIEEYLIKRIGKICNNTGPLSNIEDGGKLFNNRIKCVLQYDLDGNFVNEYNSVGEAVSFTNIENIGPCCRGIRRTAGLFIWKYKECDNYPDKINVDFLKNMIHFGNYETSVLQYDINGNYINEFSSIKCASESSGCHKSKIVDVCKGKRKHTKKFIWKYKKDIIL